VVGAARLEGGEPAAEAGELIWRQLGNSFGDLFDFHAPQYNPGGGLVEPIWTPLATMTSRLESWNVFADDLDAVA